MPKNRFLNIFMVIISKYLSALTAYAYVSEAAWSILDDKGW